MVNISSAQEEIKPIVITRIRGPMKMQKKMNLSSSINLGPNINRCLTSLFYIVDQLCCRTL